MTKSFRLKLMIIVLSVLALCVTAAAFSVSYARWTGKSSVAATGGIGSWNAASPAVQKLCDSFLVVGGKDYINEQGINTPAIAELRRAAGVGGITGSWNNQTGGIIYTDGTSTEAAAQIWRNSPGNDGYEVEVVLTQGQAFFICVFNRIVDPTNVNRVLTDKEAEIAVNDADALQYYLPTDLGNGIASDDPERVVFTVQKSGKYKFSVYENGDLGHDVVTIAYSAA